MGDGAHGNALNAGCGHGANRLQSNPSGRFEGDLAAQSQTVAEGNGFAQLWDGKIVQQNGVNSHHVQESGELREALHLDFDEGGLDISRGRPVQHFEDTMSESVRLDPGQMVVLEEHRIMEIVVPESILGQTLRGSKLRSYYGLIVLAIKSSKTGEYRFMPEADDVMKEGDILIVFGREVDLARFSALD